MRIERSSTLLLSVALLLVGCTANAPHYGAFISASPSVAGLAQRGQIPVTWNPMQPPACPVVPVALGGRSNIEVSPGYTFGVVEFDDAGRFYNPRQLTCLLQELHREARKQSLILATYVHGWKSDDAPDDQDLLAFRQMLQNASEHPLEKPAPRLVGIYVGWRGKAITGSSQSIWQNISYFNRKGAANNIAEGESRTLFAKLSLFQQAQNQRHLGAERDIQRPWIRQILIGHSFGAAIAFNAISPYLIRAAADSEPDHGRYKTILPSGSVAILINPAFSAARYTALYNLATHRCYNAYQKPVLIILSSENDWPDKLAFPIGQMLRPTITVPRQDDPAIARDEAKASRTAVGFFGKYINRRINYVGGRASSLFTSRLSDRQEGQHLGQCPQTANRLLEKMRPYIVPYGDWVNVAHHWDIQHLRGDPLNPFWVASVDARILNGHSNSFTAPFTDLLTDLFQNLTNFSDNELAAAHQ